MIFPLSPTNIIPSLSSERPSNSSGVGGFIPPSYQINSNGGKLSCLANLNRTIEEYGKATSFCTPKQTWLLMPHVVVPNASAEYAGVLMPSVRNNGHKL